MIDSVNKNQEKLLDIINKLFEYVEDPITKQEVVRIHSKLTDMSLQDIVSDTRNIIIELNSLFSLFTILSFLKIIFEGLFHN